jgi:hypothetical protein
MTLAFAASLLNPTSPDNAGRNTVMVELANLPAALTECRSPEGFLSDWHQAGLQSKGISHGGSLRLVRAGEELLVEYLTGDKRRRDSVTVGAKLLSADPELDLYHFLLTRAEQTEHLLFAKTSTGSGQLIWSTPDSSFITDCGPEQGPQ